MYAVVKLRPKFSHILQYSDLILNLVFVESIFPRLYESSIIPDLGLGKLFSLLAHCQSELILLSISMAVEGYVERNVKPRVWQLRALAHLARKMRHDVLCCGEKYNYVTPSIQFYYIVRLLQTLLKSWRLHINSRYKISSRFEIMYAWLPAVGLGLVWWLRSSFISFEFGRSLADLFRSEH